MRIHSSSLTLTPANYNRQQVGKQDSAQNKNENKGLLVATDTHDTNQLLVTTYSSEEIRPSLNAELTVSLMTNTPSNTRILSALTAYSQELNKPILDQRVRAIQRIDTYA